MQGCIQVNSGKDGIVKIIDDHFRPKKFVGMEKNGFSKGGTYWFLKTVWCDVSVADRVWLFKGKLVADILQIVE